MGEFFGAVLGAVISGIVAVYIFRKENDDKIKDVMEGADREVAKELKGLEIGNLKSIADEGINLDKQIQAENAEISKVMNAIKLQQNKITEEHNNKMIEIQDSLRELRELEIENQKENLRVTKEISDNKIDADIIAKARLDWLKEVREIQIELVSQANIFLKCINTIMDHHVRHLEYNQIKAINSAQHELESRNKYVDELNNSLMESKKQFHFLNLFFGSDEQNDELIESAKSIVDYAEIMNKLVIESFNNFKNYPMIKANRDTVFNRSNDFDEKINNFIDKSRKYNKEVWETAKQIK